MKDAAGRENFAVIHPRDESIKSWGSFLSFRLQSLDNWTALSSQSLRLRLIISCSFFLLQTLERLRDILTTWVRPWFERKERTYLWSRQQSPENRFSSLFLINLWAKTRDSDILQRRLREIYNPSGRSLSSISHEDLTVLSCEAGDGVLFFYCSSDRSRLAFLCGAVGMWQQQTWCGHWKQSRSWQVEGPEQWGDCRVGPQLQFL